ncbi:MAG: short-subunit dehydrogenase [Halioglobus sp.]|jgi:short-subunit dehydrogenase
MDLENKIVLLTGATGGIGAAVAQQFAKAGARLILVSRSEDKLNALSAELAGQGHVTVAADITTPAGRKQIVEACQNGLDVLVNNAGVNHFGMLDEQSEEQLISMFEVNMLAPILLTRALLEQLRKCDSAIINIGSGYGSIGCAGYCGYSATKFGLRGFTEALRRELDDSSVSVGYLAPRATATGMNSEEVVAMNSQLGNRMDDAEWVAKQLMILLSQRDGARFLGWPERFFIKLNCLFPGVVDKALGRQLPIIRRYALAAASKGG